MGQRPNELTPGKSPVHFWGAELRARREKCGLSLAELGRRIHHDPSNIARYEKAAREQKPSAEFARQVDHALSAGGALERLRDLIPDRLEHRHVAKSGPHVASTLSEVATTAAAAPSLGEGEDAESVVVPARTSDGKVLFVSVPRRAFLKGASAAVAAAGTGFPSIAPRVANAADVHPVERYQAARRVLIDSDNMFGPTNVIGPCVKQIEAIQELRQQFGGEDRRRLLRLQADYAELAGWFHQDIGAHDRALYWTDRALQWSHGVQDSELTCFILARKAQLAADMGDGLETIEVAEAAEHMAAPGSRLEAIAATMGAHGHALRGTRDATMRAYDHVHELLRSLDSDPASSWGVWLNDAYVDVAQYRSLAHLGDYAVAAEGFDRAIGDLPTGFHRDRGVYLARAARAHAGNGNADHAATLGVQALAIGIETTSGRILTELASLDDTIKSIDNPAVAEFHDAISSTLVHQA